MANKRDLPPPQSPFVEVPAGTLSSDGYQYLLSLLNVAKNSILTSTVATGLTATGANQATALQLSSQWNEIDTTPAGTGVLLGAYQPGQSQTVFNQGLNPLNVYPSPGSQIDALGANVAYSLASGSERTFNFVSGAQIR